MKNVLLFESHYRSRSWFLALQEISNLYIVSVLREEKIFFLSHGVPEQKILNLSLFQPKNINLKIALKYLKKYEDKYKLTFMNYVLMDRTLRGFDYEYVVKYLYFIHFTIFNFIKKNSIDIIFIEPTWAHELIAYEIAKELNLKYYAPVREKINESSFYLFKSIFRDEYLIKNDDKKRKSIQLLINNKAIKTPYFDHFLNRNKLTYKKFSVLFDLLRLKLFNFHNKHIHPPLISQLFKKFMAILRYYLFLWIIDFYDIRNLSQRFILLTLHVQPEAGIDVVGFKYSNQLEYVRQIAMNTPSEYIILVKEHPHDFGRRNLFFYQQLKLIPNVKIINPLLKTNDIYTMKNISLVVSVAGTASLEAALLGIPAVTSSRMYYHSLMVVDVFDPFAMSLKEILNFAKIKKLSKKTNIKKYKSIVKNAFSGICVDFKTDVNAISLKNVADLQNAFREAIN